MFNCRSDFDTTFHPFCVREYGQSEKINRIQFHNAKQSCEYLFETWSIHHWIKASLWSCVSILQMPIWIFNWKLYYAVLMNSSAFSLVFSVCVCVALQHFDSERLFFFFLLNYYYYCIQSNCERYVYSVHRTQSTKYAYTRWITKCMNQKRNQRQLLKINQVLNEKK